MILMETQGISRLVSMAAGGLCGFSMLGSAVAAPLTSRLAPLIATAVTNPSAKVSLFPPVVLRAASPTPLDLRASHELVAAGFHAGTAAFAFRALDSGIQQPVHGVTDSGELGRSAPSGLGISDANFRAASPAQRIVDRVRREGLPIARLWQSNSALLSIGLNQRGKPGIWFTKTIP
jgi:hypothetical protein